MFLERILRGQDPLFLEKARYGMSLLERIKEEERKIHGELTALSQAIYEHPELGHEEYEACRLHTEILKKHGFEVEVGSEGMKTAFHAVYKSSKPGPAFGFMSEYDALPEIGHGCGHNMIGTVGTGAGIVLSKVIEEVGGSVEVFGTPAEETWGGKVVFADNGRVDHLCAAMMAHPNANYHRSGEALAIEALRFEFYGKPAHASSFPDKGINALEGAIQTFVNINGLRQHIKSDARIHGVITNGGTVANVVPEYACADFYVRASTKSYLDELVEKVKNCARAGALSSGCEIKISNYEASYCHLITNKTMDDLFTQNLLDAGVPKVYPPRTSKGSNDMSNISFRCPAIHPYFGIDETGEVVGHTREFAKQTMTDYAKEQIHYVVSAMAMTGAQILMDEELRKKIREEFDHAER